ncbi:methyltransferase [Caulobacter sp. X]|uniref:class I SAM-dependent methyltransferase n=1 Tax=Caulobacter sp. X TaxID=2048901 RepID=UPI000C144FE9|nr:50S ribosomal protein L11 methyltransferase [Caulobacter sp. X]PIB96361.1 methyltransferase [Caulobacter sp. X]
MDLDTFIRANLPLTPAPGVPEVRLHLAEPRSGLMRLAEADPDFGSPYWARCWGGGLALARHVLDHPESVAGQRVLDLGAGSGLVAIAAMKAGAASALAVDVDPYAVVAARLNAEANAVVIETLRADLTERAPPSNVDLMLVGDLFYDADLASAVLPFLRRCAAAGVGVLIGDPWRAHLPREGLNVVAEYPVADFGDPGGVLRNAAVLSLVA